MARHASLAEQLADYGKAKRVAANDNRQRRDRQPQYRGTLPALRWLWDNRPDLAPALASALPRTPANWFVDVEPSRQEIRPTVGELMAASHDEDGRSIAPVYVNDETGCRTSIGVLKFHNGRLIEWGETRKGKKLKPTDRPRSSGGKSSASRNPSRYLATRPTTRSPMHADHYHRPISGNSVLAPMYDPLPGVASGRAFLESLKVDGKTPAACINMHVTVLPDAIAEDALFLGGISNPSGNSSSGAVMWEASHERQSSATEVIEEVAARGTLKSIGIRMGYSEADAIAGGKTALLDLCEVLASVKNRKTSQ